MTTTSRYAKAYLKATAASLICLSGVALFISMMHKQKILWAESTAALPKFLMYLMYLQEIIQKHLFLICISIIIVCFTAAFSFCFKKTKNDTPNSTNG